MGGLASRRGKVAPNGLAFSCPRRGTASISGIGFQNAPDLVERRERRGSTATPC